MLSSRLVLLVLVVLVCSGLAVELVELVPVSVPVLAVLVVFVLAVVVLVVLVLVLVDWLLLAEAFCAAHGSGPTRASSSRVASIPHAARPAGEDRVKTGNTRRNSRNQSQRITLWNGSERLVKEHMD
jgi:hypothetical protein